MSKYIEKQLLINQIGNNKYIANELLDIIKSYAFYDRKTYNTICFVKESKSEIKYIMEKIFLFYRFNHSDTNNLQCHWGLVYHTFDDELPKIHIKGDTCNNCGDYINAYTSATNIEKTRRIMCKCH